MPDTRLLAERDRRFPETHWALLGAVQGTGADPRETFETLALLYWRPVYSYIRHRWRLPNEEAKDMTQTFFLKLLESRMIERANPRRGRFRTFLRTCLENMLRNEYQAARARKRGGDRAAVSIELVDEWRGSGEDAGCGMDAEWRRQAVHGAIARLREVLWFEGKAVQFQVFIEHEMPEGDRPPSYQELGRKYGVPASTITNYLHRVRGRLRDVIMEMTQEGTAMREAP